MDSGWVKFLDIISINSEMKPKAGLEVSIESSLEIPENHFIDLLFSTVKKVYEIDESFQILWFKRTKDNVNISYLEGKTVKFDEVNIVKNLWGRFVGEYLLFLPTSINIEDIPKGDEEETIGLILSQFKNLLMKTPDGHEVLYLYIADTNNCKVSTGDNA